MGKGTGDVFVSFVIMDRRHVTVAVHFSRCKAALAVPRNRNHCFGLHQPISRESATLSVDPGHWLLLGSQPSPETRGISAPIVENETGEASPRTN